MAINCLPSTHDKDDTGWVGWLIAMVILTFTGLIINLFCFIVLLKIKSVNLNPNKFLVVLLGSQLVLCLIVAPFRIKILISTEGLDNCTLGKISDYLYSLIIASQVSHVTISYDRWLHVLLGYKYKLQMRGTSLHILLWLPWVITVGYIIAIAIGPYVQYGYLVIMAFSLIIILTRNYVRLVMKLDERDKVLGMAEESLIARKKRHNDVTSLCFFVVLLQIICSIPSLVRLYTDVHALIHLEIEGKIWSFLKDNNAVLEDICFIALLLGASINPVIYLFRHREFKKYVTNLWVPDDEVIQANYDYSYAKNQMARVTQDAFKQPKIPTQLVYEESNTSIGSETGERCRRMSVSLSIIGTSPEQRLLKLVSGFRKVKSDITLYVQKPEETGNTEETGFDMEVNDETVL